MRVDGCSEALEGFWSAQDGQYYARGVSAAGSEHWYRIADRVVTRAYVARWSRIGARSILVGTSRRRPARSAC